MGYRTFVDRNGHGWEIRDRSADEWDYVPISGNPEPQRAVPSPGHQSDPFELSIEELQRLLDAAPKPGSRHRPSPFGD